jgi:murein DD-endopeptidase MepM/ murein hydrolase activator NlpD
VTIDHGNGVYSLTAHFQQGSIPVKIGDKVKAGQFLGRVGHSSGTLPHISFLLVTNKEWLEGKGLPALFSNFERIGPDVPVRKIELGNPMTGWLVRPIE